MTHPAISRDSELQALARKHLLMHFTHKSVYDNAPLPIMKKGEGAWVWDETGKKYFDGLAGLFCVQIGYSHGEEIGEAIKRQMMTLPYYTNWSYVQEPSVRLAEKIASLAPEGMDRVFFTSSGGESNESAIKMIRQYHQARGDHGRVKFISRRAAYHGVSYGALSINGVTALRKPFEPLIPGFRHLSNTKRYHRPAQESEAEFCQLLLQELEATIVHEGPETVAGIFMEPLQNSGGSLAPPAGYYKGVREICDRYGVLLAADEVICGFGRLGQWFGSPRFDFKPDIITFAKGVASGYVPLGGVLTSSRVFDTVLESEQQMFMHGLTYGGHPAACAAGLANIAIMERLHINETVQQNEAYLRDAMRSLLEHPYVGDVRGAGYHYTIEMVADKERRDWDGAKVSALDFAHKVLAPALLERGVICRCAVDSGDATPLAQFSPPLIMTRDEIDWLVAQVRQVLDKTLRADMFAA